MSDLVEIVAKAMVWDVSNGQRVPGDWDNMGDEDQRFYLERARVAIDVIRRQAGITIVEGAGGGSSGGGNKGLEE